LARQQDIRLRRSASAGAVPTTSALNLGELAINTYDGKLYLKKSVSGTESIVEIGASGGATQQSAVYKEYVYTATSNQTSFSGSDDNSATLSYVVGYLQVFLNGVLLENGTDYTANTSSSVILVNGANTGDVLQVSTFVKVLGTGDMVTNTFTGNGSTAAYTLSTNPDTEENTIVFVDGVYQEKDTYTVSGTTLTFDANVPNGASIEVVIGSRNVTTLDAADLDISGDLTVAGEAIITGDIQGDLRGATLFKGKAGEALSKGEVVYISGISGNTTVVSKADADDAAKMPAFGVVADDASLNASVSIYTFGRLSGLDTSSYSEGDELFVSTTAGALTSTAPTGESSKLQKIAKVTRSDNSAGSIFIMGAGRSNAVPNLDDGDIFIGNGSNQAVSAALNTSIVPESGNLYYTDARVDSRLASGSLATISTSGNVTVGGNLTVEGTTTTLNTATLDVEDKNITLNYGSGDTSSTANGSGITIQDAVNSTTDATILWDASDDEFDFSHAINIPNLKISGAQGTDGQLLTSTGSGVAWEDAPASGPTFKTFGTSSIMVGDSTTGTINAADYNTGLGIDVFANLTSGDQNTVLGFEAGNALTVHNQNTLIGYQAGKLLGGSSESWEAQRNVFIGYGAGRDVDEGQRAIAIGYYAMMSSTGTTTHDIAIGYQAMQYRASNTGDSIAIGYNAHRGDINQGYQNANRNVAVGTNTLSIIETGGMQNTAIGWYAGQNATTGPYNTLIGSEAGQAVSTGQKNTLLGYQAGELITTGSFNVVLGGYDGNEGGLDIRTATNHIVISDGSGNIRIYVNNSGKVGIGTVSPGVSLDIGSLTDAIRVPNGTTGQRPTAALGQLRYNTTTSEFEGYADGAWGKIGGGGDSFGTIAVSGQSNVVAEQENDTLTLVGQNGIAITTDASSDTVTIDGHTSYSPFTTDLFTTANATTVDFVLSVTPSSEDNLIVFVEGVYQNKNSYSLSSSTLTLSGAPGSGEEVVVHIVSDLISGQSLVRNNFTGVTNQTDFTLTLAPMNANNTFVYMDGVYQEKSEYTVSGTTLSFTTAPAAGDSIEVIIPKTTELQQPATASIDDIAMFDSAAVIGNQLTSTTVASTSATTIATHAAATYRTIKYLVQCTQGTDYHSTEINLIHDGTTVYITEYGTLFDNASLGTFNATISSGNILLQITPGSATSMAVKVMSSAIPV